MPLIPLRSLIWLSRAMLLLVTVGITHAERPRMVLEGDGFVIISDASEKQVRQFALGYAAYRQVFQQMLAPDSRLQAPARILLFRRQVDFEKLARQVPRSAGSKLRPATFSFDVDDTACTAMALDGDRRQALRLLTEFNTMNSLRRSGYFLPVWMTQGSGAVLSNMERRRNRITVGRHADGHAARLERSHWIPWDRFFEINLSSPEYRDVEKGEGTFHAQAWLLMHYVLMGEGGGKARFEALAEGLRTAPWDFSAVQTVLGLPEPDDLGKTLRRHLSRRPNLQQLEFDEAGMNAAFHTRPATNAEWWVELSNLAALTDHPWEAFDYLEQARAAEPENLAVLEALARRELREKRLAGAIEFYRAAIAGGSTNPQAYLRSAHYRLERAGAAHRLNTGSVGEPAQQALAEVRRALELNPGSEQAYYWLAHALVVAKDVPPEAVAALDQGIVATAEGASTRYLRSLLRRRLGDHDGSMADLRYIANDPKASADLRQRAQESVAREVYLKAAAEVQAAANAHDFGRAQAVWDQAQEELSPFESADIDADMTRLAAWLDHGRDWFQLDVMFRAGGWAEFLQAAERFMETYPKSTTLARVRRRIAEAREKLETNPPRSDDE